MVAGRSNTEIRQSDSRCISNSKVFTAFMSRRHHLTDDSSDDTGRKIVTWLLWDFDDDDVDDDGCGSCQSVMGGL